MFIKSIVFFSFPRIFEKFENQNIGK